MKESRKRTECVYVRPEHKKKVRRYVLKLERYDENKIETKEERNKKKKNQKENKKKEEKDTHTTREALKISFKETPKNDFVVPTAEEVQSYLDEIGEHRFTGEYFVAKMNSVGWMAGNTRIVDWKAYIKSSWQKKEDEQQLKQQQKNEKQKTKSVKTTSDAKDGVGENGEPPRVESEEPALPRRELVEKMLREKYPVDEAQAERMEAVVAGAMAVDGGPAEGGGTAGKAADSIDYLAADMGDDVVVSWIAKSILARAESLGTDDRKYDGSRVIADAESILMCAKGAYRGRLTARIFLKVLNGIEGLTKGKLGMEIMLKMKTIK